LLEREQGRLMFWSTIGAEYLVELNKPLWSFSGSGLRMLRLAINTHIITSHFALPLCSRNQGD